MFQRHQFQSSLNSPQKTTSFILWIDVALNLGSTQHTMRPFGPPCPWQTWCPSVNITFYHTSPISLYVFPNQIPAQMPWKHYSCICNHYIFCQFVLCKILNAQIFVFLPRHLKAYPFKYITPLPYENKFCLSILPMPQKKLWISIRAPLSLLSCEST